MKVQILLSMRNAREFLADQIDSLVWQEHRVWRYLVRDAGSSDDSIDIARRYDLRIAPRIIRARAAGSNDAAMAILRSASPGADLYAMCGGDDLWHEHKLARAVAHFSGPGDVPRLYCARARLIRPDGVSIGPSAWFPERLTLLRLLFEPAVIGPTIVINRAALGVLRRAPLKTAPLWPWAMALAVAAAGGEVVFDAEPVIDLRLHPGKWLAVTEDGAGEIADPACAGRLDMHASLALLHRHLAFLRAFKGHTPQAGHVLDGVTAALASKAARRALADHPGLDGGPFWRSLRLKRMIRRGLP